MFRVPRLPNPERAHRAFAKAIGELAAQAYSPKRYDRDRKEYLQEGLYAKASAEESSSVLPLPLHFGLELLSSRRDFRLPGFYVSLSGEATPQDFRPVKKNIYVNCSNKLKHLPRPPCLCSEECGEDCVNRAVMYECDDVNCPASGCTNRRFQEYDVALRTERVWARGVEARLAGDRGHGLFAIRPFAPGELVADYRGEVITLDECHRRLAQKPGSNHFYFLDFDQGLIIDASRKGSLARYANHSCAPNTYIEKWIVQGEPRIGLFAGPHGVAAGDEICYDYNFTWFEGATTQKCLCGARTCTGVIGKSSKAKAALSKAVGATKRGNRSGTVKGKAAKGKGANDKAVAKAKGQVVRGKPLKSLALSRKRAGEASQSKNQRKRPRLSCARVGSILP